MAIHQNKMFTSTDKCVAGRHLVLHWLANTISQFKETDGEEDCQVWEVHNRQEEQERWGNIMTSIPPKPQATHIHSPTAADEIGISSSQLLSALLPCPKAVNYGCSSYTGSVNSWPNPLHLSHANLRWPVRAHHSRCKKGSCPYLSKQWKEDQRKKTTSKITAHETPEKIFSLSLRMRKEKGTSEIRECRRKGIKGNNIDIWKRKNNKKKTTLPLAPIKKKKGFQQLSFGRKSLIRIQNSKWCL